MLDLAQEQVHQARLEQESRLMCWPLDAGAELVGPHRAEQEQAALAALNYQAWQTISAEKVDIEAALTMQDLYRSVKAAAAQR